MHSRWARRNHGEGRQMSGPTKRLAALIHRPSLTSHKNRLIASVLCFFAIAVYICSFLAPAFATDEQTTNYGYEVFYVAFLSIFEPILGGWRLIIFLEWLANPLLWFALLRFTKGRYITACVAGMT